MKLASKAPIKDEGIRRDEKRRRLRRCYRLSGREVRCVASNFVPLAAGRAVIIANVSAEVSAAKRSLLVFENKAGFVSLTGG
jgi:hypothetical protein